MIGIAASHLAERGLLSPSEVVATVVSNRGLELWLADRGIVMHRTDVGDRFVSHRMIQGGIQIGGEASGHVIFGDHSPTGDGILTAVKLLEIAHDRGEDLPTLARAIPLFPQCSRNIACDDPARLAESPRTQEILQEAERDLGVRGRIVLRPSGTQPFLRILVESEDADRCEAMANRLEKGIRKISHL
jgi:phosphoglucosamine mutase